MYVIYHSFLKANFVWDGRVMHQEADLSATVCLPPEGDRDQGSLQGLETGDMWLKDHWRKTDKWTSNDVQEEHRAT